jgi:hypothetical protein
MINKTDEQRRRRRMSTMKEGRNNYRNLKNKLGRARDKVKKEYLETICDEIMEFQRTGHYNSMLMNKCN